MIVNSLYFVFISTENTFCYRFLRHVYGLRRIRSILRLVKLLHSWMYYRFNVWNNILVECITDILVECITDSILILLSFNFPFSRFSKFIIGIWRILFTFIPLVLIRSWLFLQPTTTIATISKLVLVSNVCSKTKLNFTYQTVLILDDSYIISASQSVPKILCN